MNAFAMWAIARLKEPSTYAGLSAFVLGLTFLPGSELALAAKAIAAASVAVPAILAVVLPEGGSK